MHRFSPACFFPSVVALIPSSSLGLVLSSSWFASSQVVLRYKIQCPPLGEDSFRFHPHMMRGLHPRRCLEYWRATSDGNVKDDFAFVACNQINANKCWIG